MTVVICKYFTITYSGYHLRLATVQFSQQAATVAEYSLLMVTGVQVAAIC